MKTQLIRSRIFASLALGALSMIPVIGFAQSNRHDQNRGGSQASQPSRGGGRSQGSVRGNAGASNRGSGNSGFSNPGRSGGGNSGSRGQSPARSAGGNQNGRFGGNQNSGRANSDSFGQGNRGNDRGSQSRDFGRNSQGSRDRGRSGFSIGIGIGGGYYNGGYGYGNGGYARNDNEWNVIAELSGGVALLGALEGDDTLFFAGSAGALYSLYRYDEDRNCEDPALRLRAAYFSRPYFYRDGRRYDRVMVNRHGERYYQFLRR